MDDLLQQGITAYKAGKSGEARKLFIAVVQQTPENELGWGWMYQTSSNDRERVYCLKQMLRINPKNEKTAQLLAQLLAPPPPAPIVTPPADQTNPPDIAAGKCPRCHETIQKGASRCTYCGWDINEEKMVRDKKNARKKTNSTSIVLGLMAALMIFGLIYYGLVNGSVEKMGTTAAPTRTPEENAWYACTLFIENQLKISILDAQGYTSSGVILLDNGQYRVDVGYAKLATTYTCILLDHTDGNWELMSLGATQK